MKKFPVFLSKMIFAFLLIVVCIGHGVAQKFYLKDDPSAIYSFERQICKEGNQLMSGANSLLQEGYYKSVDNGSIAKVIKPSKIYSWSGTEWHVDLLVKFYSDVKEISSINGDSRYYEFYLEHYKGNCYYMFLENGCNGSIFTKPNQFYSCYDYNDYQFVSGLD